MQRAAKMLHGCRYKCCCFKIINYKNLCDDRIQFAVYVATGRDTTYNNNNIRLQGIAVQGRGHADSNNPL